MEASEILIMLLILALPVAIFLLVASRIRVWGKQVLSHLREIQAELEAIRGKLNETA